MQHNVAFCSRSRARRWREFANSRFTHIVVLWHVKDGVTVIDILDY